MMKYLRVILPLLVLSNLAWAEDAPKAPKPKDISAGMAQVWCEKMKECSKDASMGPQECKKILYRSFMTGFENASKAEAKVDVSAAALDQCTQSIKTCTCDSLKTAQSLPGCEFIGLISKPL